MTTQATRLSQASEDELRLLGNYSGDTSQEAYTIPKPGRQEVRPKMPGKGILNGGPQPRNDLALRTVEPPFPNFVKSRAGATKRSALDFETSRGNKVTPETRSKHFTNHGPLPQGKRRKENPPAIISDDDLSSNCTDYLVSHKSQIPKTSQTSSIQSQISMAYSNRHVSQGQYYNGPKIREFRALEQTMKSGCKGHQERAKAGMAWSQPNGPLEILPADSSSESQPIDLDLLTNDTKHKVRIQPNHKGTARNVEMPSKTRQGAGHTAKSREVIVVDDKKTLTVKTTKPSEANLRHKFIDNLGSRRFSDALGSSDELAGGNSPNTLSGGGRLSRPEPVGIDKTSQAIPTYKRVAHSMEDSPGLDKSIIAPKVLNKSKASQPVKMLPVHPRDEFRPWGLEVCSVNIGSEHIKSDDLGFFLSEDEKEFNIGYNGCVYHSVKVARLLKLIWSQSTSKVRLETSKTGIDDSKLDLELRTEKDVSILIEKLQNLNPFIAVTSRTSENLEKMFQRKLLDWAKSSRHGPKAPFGDVGDVGDVELMRNNKERRDKVKDALKRPEALDLPDAKRQRLTNHRSKVVDQLQAYEEDELQKCVGNDPQRHAIDDLHSTPISNILRKLGTNNQNPHLRQTRSRTSLGNSASRIEDSTKDVTETPIQKFSQHIGLGKPWTKPLIYPKDGRKKTTVEFSDLERLDEGEFLNDNLIGMYLRYLESKMEGNSTHIAKRVYFFNTYFYSSLTTSLKGRGFNYEAVQKWTKTVDIFDYDYIIVPINESAHWYVAVICNLSELYREPRLPEHAAMPISASKVLIDDREPAEPPTHSRQTEDVNQVQKMIGHEAKKASEREARKSFEDLSLACDGTKSNSGRQTSPEVQPTDRLEDMSSADLQQLEVQIRTDLSHSIPVSDIKALGTDGVTADLLNAADPQTPVSAKARRTKRKPNPPTNAYDALQPTIVTFDSLGAAHPQTTRYLKRYLIEEAQTRGRGMPWEDSRIKGMTAAGIPVQDNFCDCGLFLLGYMENFVVNPEQLIRKTLRKELDADKDWPDFDAGHLRNRLRELIQTLHAEQEHEWRQEKKHSASKAGKYHSKDLVKRPSSPPDDATESRTFKSDQEDNEWSTLSQGIGGILDFKTAATELSETPEKNEVPGTNYSNGHTEIGASSTITDETSDRRTLQGPIIIVDSQSDTQLIDATPRHPQNLREDFDPVELPPATTRSPSAKHQTSLSSSSRDKHSAT